MLAIKASLQPQMRLAKKLYWIQAEIYKNFGCLFWRISQSNYIRRLNSLIRLNPSLVKCSDNYTITSLKKRIPENFQKLLQDDPRLKSQKLFYDNLEKDKLIVQLVKSGSPRAQAVIPLWEIRSKGSTWMLTNLKPGRDFEVGTINMDFEFVNSMKQTRIKEVIQEIFFKEFLFILFGNNWNLETTGGNIIIQIQPVKDKSQLVIIVLSLVTPFQIITRVV